MSYPRRLPLHCPTVSTHPRCLDKVQRQGKWPLVTGPGEGHCLQRGGQRPGAAYLSPHTRTRHPCGGLPQASALVTPPPLPGMLFWPSQPPSELLPRTFLHSSWPAGPSRHAGCPAKSAFEEKAGRAGKTGGQKMEVLMLIFVGDTVERCLTCTVSEGV